MEEPLQVIIRKAQGQDLAFIYAAWRNALWFAEHPGAEPGPDAIYKARISQRLNRLFRNPEIDPRMACLKQDPDMLIGWAVLTGTNLEFAYVKIDYRRKGIGRLLTKGFQTFSPPETRIGKTLAQNLGSSSAVEPCTVNATVGGSIPSSPAT